MWQCLCTCIHAFLHISPCMHAYTHPSSAHPCTHPYIHTYIHVHTHVYNYTNYTYFISRAIITHEKEKANEQSQCKYPWQKLPAYAVDRLLVCLLVCLLLCLIPLAVFESMFSFWVRLRCQLCIRKIATINVAASLRLSCRTLGKNILEQPRASRNAFWSPGPGMPCSIWTATSHWNATAATPIAAAHAESSALTSKPERHPVILTEPGWSV